MLINFGVVALYELVDFVLDFLLVNVYELFLNDC
jgi:hypothetical protein